MAYDNVNNYHATQVLDKHQFYELSLLNSAMTAKKTAPNTQQVNLYTSPSEAHVKGKSDSSSLRFVDLCKQFEEPTCERQITLVLIKF